MKGSGMKQTLPPGGQMAGRNSPGASGDWTPGYSPQ